LGYEIGDWGGEAVVGVGEGLAEGVGEEVLVAVEAEGLDFLGEGGVVGGGGDEAG